MADELFLHPSNFPIHEASIPEALIEVPLPSWHTIEEAEFEKVANAEVGEGAELLLMQHAGFGCHVFSDEVAPKRWTEQCAQYLNYSIHSSIRVS